MEEPTVVVGMVTKPHGLRGEVSVQNRSDNPERWASGAHVFTEDGRELTIDSVRPHGRRLLVRFVGVEDRTAAEALRGVSLAIPESWLPELPEGQYWPHQLEGCEVSTESGRSLGTITEVVPNPANDLWVAVDGEGVETLVPALRSVIVHVDVNDRQVKVRDVPGITAPAEPT